MQEVEGPRILGLVYVLALPSTMSATCLPTSTFDAWSGIVNYLATLLLARMGLCHLAVLCLLLSVDPVVDIALPVSQLMAAISFAGIGAVKGVTCSFTGSGDGQLLNGTGAHGDPLLSLR